MMEKIVEKIETTLKGVLVLPDRGYVKPDKNCDRCEGTGKVYTPIEKYNGYRYCECLESAERSTQSE